MTIAIAAEPAATSCPRRERGALGPESRILEDELRKAALPLGVALQEQSVEADRWKAVQCLRKAFLAARAENWDGYGARAVPESALREAVRFLLHIPPHLPMPEADPLPAGDLGLVWYGSQGRSMIVALSGNAVLSYAAMFGAEQRSHGSVYFFDDVPADIIRCIRRVLA